MPRFYFNVIEAMPDAEGFELPNLSAARTEAVKVAGGMLKDGPPDEFWSGNTWQISITDGPSGTGEVLMLLNITAS